MKPTFKAQQFEQTITAMTSSGTARPYLRTSISVAYVSACGHVLIVTDICEERPKEWDAHAYVPADEAGIVDKTFSSLSAAVEWCQEEMPKHVAKWQNDYGKSIDLPGLNTKREG